MTPPVAPAAGWYLAALGLAAGLAVLAITAYTAVGPSWLRWSLIASGALAIGRYATMTAFATSAAPEQLAGLQRFWFGTSIGLTWPTAVAMDQLVRHPAMTPKKLFTFYAPFLAVYLAVLAAGTLVQQTDPIVAVSPELVGWGRGLIIVAQSAFVGLVLWMGGRLVRKLPAGRTRLAVALLMAAHAYLGLDGVVLALGGWYVRPFLYSEMLALAAIWFALDTARHHPL
jgi:hypothetical protein